MHLVLTILLSFYPTIFLYTSIPSVWMRKLDDLAPAGPTFFFIHLIAFIAIFALVYIVLKKFISLGYGSSLRRGIVGIVLVIVFMIALALIAFYNVLPGNLIYNSPAFLDAYLLKNPYTIIALIAPFAYLFFE